MYFFSSILWMKGRKKNMRNNKSLIFVKETNANTTTQYTILFNHNSRPEITVSIYTTLFQTINNDAVILCLMLFFSIFFLLVSHIQSFVVRVRLIHSTKHQQNVLFVYLHIICHSHITRSNKWIQFYNIH